MISSRLRRRAPATLALALLLTLTACGSDGDQAAVSAGTPAPAATAEGNACADAQGEIQAGAGATGNVDSVEVGSCDLATVTSKLGSTPDDVQAALGICAIAANEASSHGVAKVSIVSSDGTELATGTNAGDCVAAS